MRKEHRITEADVKRIGTAVDRATTALNDLAQELKAIGWPDQNVMGYYASVLNLGAQIENQYVRMSVLS